MTNNKFKKILAASLFLAPTQVLAAFEYNLPKPVATVTEDIFDLHMFTSYVAMIIMAIVTAIIVYSLYTHRKSRGYVCFTLIYKAKRKVKFAKKVSKNGVLRNSVCKLLFIKGKLKGRSESLPG